MEKDNKFLQLFATIVKESCKELNIPIPKIKVINNPSYTEEHQSYGGYCPQTETIYVVVYKRTLADGLRTYFHEKKHSEQNSNGELTPGAGKDGDKFENEANAYAGKKMRELGRKYPEIFFLRYDN